MYESHKQSASAERIVIKMSIRLCHRSDQIYAPMAQRTSLYLLATCAVMHKVHYMTPDVYRPPFLKSNNPSYPANESLPPEFIAYSSHISFDKELTDKITKNSSYILRILPKIVNKHSSVKYKHFIIGRALASETQTSRKFLFIISRITGSTRKPSARVKR